MTTARNTDLLQSLPQRPASDVKSKGWPDVVASVRRVGRLAVTSHGRAQVVLLSLEEYGELVQRAEAGQARQADVLDDLRKVFDERLAALQASEASERLAKVFESPPRLRKRIKAGDS
jgi:prevent-host-death family protein